MHTIKNQNGKYICGSNNIDNICYMLDHGLDSIIIEEMKISVISDFIKDDERETIVKIVCKEDHREQGE